MPLPPGMRPILEPPSPRWKSRLKNSLTGFVPSCLPSVPPAPLSRSTHSVRSAAAPWRRRRARNGRCSCVGINRSSSVARIWSAETVDTGFFPLDEQLGLLAGPYSPCLLEAMVRLGTRLPFDQAAEEVCLLCGVALSGETVRRWTEAAGGIEVQLEQADLERLEREAPDDPAGPALQQVSADGAMVPVVGGNWTEVRTLAIGTIIDRHGEPHAEAIRYYSRRCTADAFIRQTALPTHEQGTRTAGTVVAVSDGAGWIQELIDEHRPDAVRIIDFTHAVGYLRDAANAVFGAGSREAAVWLDTWVPALKKKEPEEVLAALKHLPTPNEEAIKAKRTALGYVKPRLERMRYADFQQQGYPIGSGIVESAGKLVVEARLKGSGMHWKDANLNPMLALRSRLCSKRWTETWAGITAAWRAAHRQKHDAAWRDRCGAKAAKRPPPESAPASPSSKRERVKTVVDGHPTPEHPWNRDTPLPKTWARPPKT